MKKKKILVFSGAGVSKESGVETFRDSPEGLWNNYDVMKIAHIDAWKKDPQNVINFYNLRREEMSGVKPNKAHDIISELEKYFDVIVVTQNVDSLHEQAGSTKVIHLHGEINKLRSEVDPNIITEWKNPLKLGDLAEDGCQLRPDIIWFGEELRSDRIEEVRKEASDASVCIIIGTSMQVSPANGIPLLTPETSLIYYVDPGEREFKLPRFRELFFYHIQEPATIGMESVKKELLTIFKIQ